MYILVICYNAPFQSLIISPVFYLFPPFPHYFLPLPFIPLNLFSFSLFPHSPFSLFPLHFPLSYFFPHFIYILSLFLCFSSFIKYVSFPYLTKFFSQTFYLQFPLTILPIYLLFPPLPHDKLNVGNETNEPFTVTNNHFSDN